MKRHQIIAITFLLLQSCTFSYKKLDKKEASQLVRLESNDLSTFSQLKQELINDSSLIRKQNDETTAPPNRTNWLSTNSYYLNQIDSSKYALLFSKLKGKLVDDISLNKNGSVIFTIKQNVQMNDNDYNETYSHQLISRDCNCRISNVFNHVDTVFVDSIINKDWTYVFYKILTGH
jgi:hypothetical protein